MTDIIDNVRINIITDIFSDTLKFLFNSKGTDLLRKAPPQCLVFYEDRDRICVIMRRQMKEDDTNKG
jgi:hypothetical protein